MADKVVITKSKLDALANKINAKARTTGAMTIEQMGDTVDGIPSKIENLSWHQCPELARAFVEEVTYDSDDYTVSSIETYAQETTVSSDYKPIGLTVGNQTFYNEVPNVATAFATEEIAGTVTPLDQVRYINTPSAPNVRDLGGWKCDGGNIKYGLLFRGGEPTASDRTVLVEELGIQHDLNLRGAIEATWIISPLGEDIYFTKADQYNWYQAKVNDAWKINIRCVFDAVAHNEPVFFHCAAGADRTGTLACVLEGLLGMSQSDIDKDYELTCFYSGTDTDTTARRRNEAEWQGLINDINTYIGDTFRDKCVAFVAEMGFTADEINTYRRAMINGEPEDVAVNVDVLTVTSTLANVFLDNEFTSITEFQPYEATVTVPNGYVIEDIKVTMGGVNITSSVFNGTKTNLRRAITKNATNCSINGKKAVIDGQDFVAVITANSGYTLDGGMITITMGGIDMAEYYSDGKIAIPNVTGDIIITATAIPTATNYTNQVAISLDTDGSIFNEKGYIENGRLNSSGVVVEDGLEGYNYIATGFIPFNWGDVIRFENAYILNYNNDGMRTITYDSDFNLLVSPLSMTPYQLSMGNISSQIEIEQGDVGMTYQGIKKITLPSSPTYGSDACYVRFTLERPSTDVVPIVTLNEEID